MPATGSHTVSVLLDDALLVLNRAVGLLRRRDLPLGHFAVGPSGTAGVAKLTFVLDTDDATAERVVHQLQKVIGVHEVVLVKSGSQEAGAPTREVGP